ncbi:MAG: C4-dicarboxylate ABC transporter [Deltaproteobacteria bacterium RBG_19FT_COMBO_46_12]|nr:MAG: C4-dicarboxylate ABC transporter [Deltaproteobacteria bacterium RBG_19FT_COMBO_46_12]
MKCLKNVSTMVAVFMVLFFTIAFYGSPAFGQQKYLLKFNHVLSPKDPYHPGFLNWAKAVEEKTKGGLKIEVFPSAQLGVEEDILEQIRAGANIGQNTDSARMGNYVPGIAILNGPYCAENLNEVAKIKNAPTIKAFHDELANKFGFKVLSFSWVQGYRHFFTNKPIRTPEDLKGLRIRTPPTPIWQESVRALGATPVAMAFGEMYPALQQKVIDGVELVYNNIPGGRFYEVLKYVSETGHIMLVNYEVISAKWFNALPPNYQKILVDECEKAGIATSKLIMDKLEKEVKADLIKRGMIVVDKVDLPAFRKAGEKAYEVLKIADVKKKVFNEIGKK